MREVSDSNAAPQSLLERLKDYGQEDVFALWDELSPEERDLLVKDIEVCVIWSSFFCSRDLAVRFLPFLLMSVLLIVWWL